MKEVSPMDQEKQGLARSVEVLVIGGGPAGLFTAVNLSKPKKCLILEKNESPGRKLLLSGSGRCNLTHAGDMEAFFSHYGDHFRFLRTAFKHFTNQDLIQFFKERGMFFTRDQNGKIFPASNQAIDLLRVLIEELERKKIALHRHQTVVSLQKIPEGFRVETQTHTYTCQYLVIATGGKSYPHSGSTGDGYRFARSLGHTIVPPKPALTPVFIHDYPFAPLSGISLPQRTITLYRQQKKIKEHTGDIGFTHKGLSGPGILDLSRYMEKNDCLKINLIGRSPEEFSATLLQAGQTEGKTGLKTYLKQFDLPENLIKAVLFHLELEVNEKLANLTKKGRIQLIEAWCGFPFLIESLGGFNMAMVTRGGVSLSEVSSHTMESKLVPQLYFVGEILDIDGDTGGYNLQAAFSTGYLAAQSINEQQTQTLTPKT